MGCSLHASRFLRRGPRRHAGTHPLGLPLRATSARAPPAVCAAGGDFPTQQADQATEFLGQFWTVDWTTNSQRKRVHWKVTTNVRVRVSALLVTYVRERQIDF